MKQTQDAMATEVAEEAKVNARSFYGEWHGHKTRHLKLLLPRLRASYDSLIFTAGDSSLDNKYWVPDCRPAPIAVYREFLEPPTSVCDLTYWLNYHLEHQQRHGSEAAARKNSEGFSENRSPYPTYAAINTAVEATTLNERCYGLRPQDRFIRDNIRADDVLVVSIGGNDVALAPTPCTIASICGMLALPMKCVENGISCCVCPMNDCCCGCGPSLFSCAGTFPPCLGYFRHLFGVRVQKYIESLTSKTKPRKILVCMIYYPDETPTPSWAGPALGALGYNSNPGRLQLLIRKAFEEATRRIQIPGCEVIPVPLFNVLDGKRSEDFVARVEPSAIGGQKMAQFLLDYIQRPSGEGSAPVVRSSSIQAAPATSLMADR